METQTTNQGGNAMTNRIRRYTFKTPCGLKDIEAETINQAQQIADTQYGGGNATMRKEINNG